MKETDTNRNHMLFSKILYFCKKIIPNNIIFVFLFYLVKFIGAIILTYNFNTSNTIYDIRSILRYITVIQDVENSILLSLDYNLLSYSLFFLSFIPLIVMYIIYKTKKNKENFKFNKFEKALLMIISLIFTISMFFFQHLIEILFFIFTHSYMMDNINIIMDDKVKLFMLNFENKLYISKYFYCCLNSITTIIMNILLYSYITFMNEPFIHSECSVKFYKNKKMILFFIFISNFQGIQYLPLFLNVENFILVVNIIYVILSFILLINFYQLFHFSNVINIMIITLTCFCFFTSLLECGFYFMKTNHFVLNRYILEIVATSTYVIFFLNYKKRKNLKNFEKDLFIMDERRVNMNSLLTFCEFLDICVKDTKNILYIFHMISAHKTSCSNEYCVCTKFVFENFSESFLKSKEICDLNSQERRNKFKSLFNDFILLIESEITNMIYLFYKNGELDDHYNYLILHIDFIFHFHNNYPLVNFYIDNYETKLKNLPFIYKFYFYIFKKKVSKSYRDLINKNKGICLKYSSFFKYLELLKDIKKTVLKNVTNFEKFMIIKNGYQMKIEKENKVLSEIKYNASEVIEICKDIKKDYKYLKSLIIKNFSSSSCLNSELCYILTNFYIVINKKVPIRILHLFCQIKSFKEFEDSLSSFPEKNISHPIIIKNIAKSYIISYIPEKLCVILNCEKDKLLGLNYELLLPKSLGVQHTILMKNYLLYEKSIKINKETFIVSYDGYYIPVQILATSFPTLYDNNIIIMDINPNLGEKNPYFRTYYFALDSNTNFLSFSKNFNQEFLIPLDILEINRITFCSLFNINYDKLKAFLKDSMDFIHSINLKNFDSLYTPFASVKLENSLKYLRDMNKTNKQICIKYTEMFQTYECFKKKEKMIPNLAKTGILINDNLFNSKWKENLNELEKKYALQTKVNRMKPFKKKVYIKGMTKRVVLENNDNVENFIIKFQLLNIGNVPFFIVEILDHELTNKHYGNIINSKLFVKSSQKLFEIIKKKRNKNINKGSSTILDKLSLATFNQTLDSKQLEIIKTANQLFNTQFSDSNAEKFCDNFQSFAFSQSTNKQAIYKKDHLEFILKKEQKKSNYENTKTEDVRMTTMNDTLSLLIKNRKIELKKPVTSEVAVKNKRYFLSRIKLGRYILIALSIIIIVVLGISFSYFVFASSIISESYNIFKLKLSLLNMKTSILYSSNTVISECITKSEYWLQNVSKEIDIFFENYSLFNNLFNLKSIDKTKIYSSFEKKRNFQAFYIESYEKKTSLHEELKIFLYLLSKLKNTQSNCDINNLLKQQSSNSNFHEMVGFYLTSNMFTQYIPIMDELLDISNEMFLNDLVDKEMIYNTFDVIYYVLLILMIFIALMSLTNFRERISFLIFFIFLKNRYDKRLENKLHFLKNVVTKSNSEAYKLNDSNLKYNRAILKRFVTSTTEESGNVFTNNSQNFDYDSLFTGVNADSTIEEELEKAPLLNMRIISKAYIALAITFLIYVSILTLSRIIGASLNDQLKKSNDIISNYISRLSSFSELLLYYKVSVVFENINYVTYPQEQYSYINNIYDVSDNLKTDSVYNNLKNSKFAHIYYILNLNRGNINNFMSKDSNLILNSLQDFENTINSKEFCNFLESKLCSSNMINSLGFNYAMDRLMENIIKLYVDYSKRKDNNPILMLLDQKFNISMFDNENVFRVMNVKSMELISKDSLKLFYKIRDDKIVIAFFSLLINIVFIFIIIVGIVPKLQEYYDSLQYAVNKFKKAGKA